MRAELLACSCPDAHDGIVRTANGSRHRGAHAWLSNQDAGHDRTGVSSLECMRFTPRRASSNSNLAHCAMLPSDSDECAANTMPKHHACDRAHDSILTPRELAWCVGVSDGSPRPLAQPARRPFRRDLSGACMPLAGWAAAAASATRCCCCCLQPLQCYTSHIDHIGTPAGRRRNASANVGHIPCWLLRRPAFWVIVWVIDPSRSLPEARRPLKSD